MDTGMTSPKTPPGDSLQAVWYSLFGQNNATSSSDSTPTSPGSTSPQFSKNGVSSNGSPIGRSADALFGVNHQYKQGSSPPGFPNSHPHSSSSGMQNNHHLRGGNAELQEALTSLLNNPQSFNQIFGGGANYHQQQQGLNGEIPSFSQGRLPHPHHISPQQHYHNQQRQQASFADQVGPNALLDLLMQSMKADGQVQQGQNDFSTMKQHNSWSSGGGPSNPPSPIGNNRSFGGLGQSQPQRNGSNGSSEMSPNSYSPFSRNSSKNILESGNGNASPIPPHSTSWSTAVLGGTPPQSGVFIGTAHHHQQHQQSMSFTSQSRNIWASPSVSPGAISLNNNSLMNPLGIKRKQNHQEGGGGGVLENSEAFLTSGTQLTQHFHAQLNQQPQRNEPLSSHYADSYFKKKKKN